MNKIVKFIFFPILTIFLLLVAYYFFVYGRQFSLFGSFNLKMVNFLQRPIELDKALSLAQENCKIMPGMKEEKDILEIGKQNQRLLQKVGIEMDFATSSTFPPEVENFASFPNPKNKDCRVALVKLRGKTVFLFEKQNGKILTRNVNNEAFETARSLILSKQSEDAN